MIKSHYSFLKVLMKYRFLPTLAASTLLILSACGGSSGTEPPTPLPNVPNVPAAITPKVGDYFVYVRYDQSVAPPGTLQPAALRPEIYFVDTVTEVNTDKSYRVETTALYEMSNVGQRTELKNLRNAQSRSGQYTPSGKWMRVKNDCSVNSAVSEGLAPTNAQPGDVFSSYEFAGQAPGVQIQNVACTRTAKFETNESKTLDIGSFKASKYSVTQSSTLRYGTEGDTYTLTETCWIDQAMGVVLACEKSTIALSGFQPPSTTVSDIRLVAYSSQGAKPVGPAVQRFSGKWLLNGTADIKICSRYFFDVDLAGKISGICQIVSEAPAAPPLALTGSVDADGKITITLHTGVVLNGQFTSPSNGAGSSNTANISWTAERDGIATIALP
jgi:hypothetical protein